MSEGQSTFEGWAVIEEWRPIHGFEGLYEVSSIGRIRRVGQAARRGNGRGGGARIGLILKRQRGERDYPIVQLWKEGRSYSRLIHILVAETFLGPAPEGMEVNHIDGTKLNASVANLEYVTRSDNMEHAYVHGLCPSGERHHWAKLTSAQVQHIRALYRPGKNGYGCRRLARQFGVAKATIQSILNGDNWKHDGWANDATSTI
jgi:hypothetical protein